ncbi:unnamed protein product [Arctogadus glacialis]
MGGCGVEETAPQALGPRVLKAIAHLITASDSLQTLIVLGHHTRALFSRSGAERETHVVPPWEPGSGDTQRAYCCRRPWEEDAADPRVHCPPRYEGHASIFRYEGHASIFRYEGHASIFRSRTQPAADFSVLTVAAPRSHNTPRPPAADGGAAER